MIVDNEKLRQQARELALQHQLRTVRFSPKRVWRDFDADVERLRSFVRSLQDCHASCSQPAEEWLLDNAEFIEEQALDIRDQLSDPLLRRLFGLRKSDQLRVESVCADYLEQTDGSADAESLVTYINAYQEVSVLSIGEAWSLPLLMRMTLIRRLADVMESVRERREICVQVERFLAHVEPSKFNAETLNAALEEAGERFPLSGPMIVHMVGHLREWADDSAMVHDWLLCKLENGPESLDRIVSYEHRLQTSYQVTAGNMIGSLRKLIRYEWRDIFQRICLAERTLREDSADTYPRLDDSSKNLLRKRVEELAALMRVPENLVAKQAVELAAAEAERTHSMPQVAGAEPAGRKGDRHAGEEDSEGRPQEDGDCHSFEQPSPPRATFLAYYLLEEDGIKKLKRALKTCSNPRSTPGRGLFRRNSGSYFALLGGSFVVIWLALSAWIGGGGDYGAAGWAAILLALLFPAGEWAVTATHWLIESFVRPRPLLRYDFSAGIPEEASTMVVIPVIWSTPEEVKDMADRLELHYLASRDPNLHFALLGDFTDASVQKLPEDAEVLREARARIEALNAAYSGPNGSTFHLFQRRREWNEAEEVWMGRERKRGKLVEFVELLRGRGDTTYDFVVSDASVYGRLRYIITLDADTQLPLGSAQRMIGTMHLPYNRPRLNRSRTRVVEGYGVLQPRIGISHESAMRSRLAQLWSGVPGVDPYAFAVSDPYQDGVGHGIFTGKGIFDIDLFGELLCERIPENRVLSHDLLEGGFLRAGLLSDIELVDEHPATFSAYQKRMHRWVRGDWQLLIWLKRTARDRSGNLQPVDLSPVTRWQMIDNLRRSLLPPVQLLLIALSLTVLPGYPFRMLAVLLITFFLPVIRQCIAVRRRSVWNPKGISAAFGQVLLTMLMLPYQSALMLHAICVTLYRICISKRHLLEWVSSAEIERSRGRGGQPLLLGMRGGYAFVVAFALAVLFGSSGALTAIGILFGVVWAAAPFSIRWLDEPKAEFEWQLSPAEQAELRTLAKQIWAYFEDLAGAEDHYLPPDNVQFEPPNGVAHRTSPTNIGFLLACIVAARDFGFIDTPGMIKRLERTVETIERMEKWNGHLYNWYDTTTLVPLPPLYVSTVDSGNLVACLLAVKEGIAEWLDRDGKAEADWAERGRRLLARIESLATGTDFRPLYDHKAKLFSLGYHAGTGERETILYDLLASEARQASFVAIALGQVSVSHWSALGRSMTKVGGKPALVSWSGTMFEYLMPWLLMRNYRDTIWDHTYQAVVNRQIEYARERGVPFGISESGYYAFDHQMNYQYRAFGVPGLGLKRGLEEDLVVAPYAAIMALPFAGRQGMDDLRKIGELDARGKYGLYEAIDYTANRMPEGRKYMVIRNFMAHHQGMSMLTLANLLLPYKMYDRFHRDKRVQAAELLLKERMPDKPAIIRRTAESFRRKFETNDAQSSAAREFATPATAMPEVCILSNGTYTSVVTNSGSGYSSSRGMAVSRWRSDPTEDDWGQYMYIRDVTRDTIWSPAYRPCRAPADEQSIVFSLDKATFARKDGEMETSLEICVSPESDAEIRRLTIANSGSEARTLEVTTYLEIVLAPPGADHAHQAFNKLFVETEYAAEAQCLLARRRPRSDDERPVWAFHALHVAGSYEGSPEFETDRSKFVGRGYSLAEPQAIRTSLKGTSGSVADPVFAMRRRITLEAGERVRLIAVTGIADTKEDAIGLVKRLSDEHQADRSFQLAWTYTQIELRHLHMTAADAGLFQTLAGRALYAAPLQQERAAGIAANLKGQSGLWPHGVSGDRPVIMLRAADLADMPFVVRMIRGHDYMRRIGIQADLVILNESAGGYQQNVQEAIRRAAEQNMSRSGEGGVYVIAANQLADEDKSLLFAVSRIVLRADGPSLRAQLRVRRERPLPAPLAAGAPQRAYEPVAAEPAQSLLFFNGMGGFTEDGKEYRILMRNGNHLPAPWINVMANPRFGSLVSELLTGYTWWRNSRECKITPWSNDPVLDRPGEACYLRDEETGESWTIAERGQSDVPFTVAHGRGYSRFRRESHGLAQELTVFVPIDDPVKAIRLHLENRSDTPRNLSVTYYAEWVLGVQREDNAPFIVTEWDESAAAIIARNAYQETFRDARAFLSIRTGPARPNLSANGQAPNGKAVSEPSPELSWTTDRREFIGRLGTAERPDAMNRLLLSGRTGVQSDSCGAIRKGLTIEPGGKRSVYILLGCEQSREAAVALLRKYDQDREFERQFERAQTFWADVLDQITVKTPSPEADVLLNNWLLYQTLSCRMWARSAFYQAGGAYGFRDQLQDSLALLHCRPDLTRAQIMLHAAHQYEEGDVQHWWHEETERGIRTRFSDDLLWLPYAVSRYVEQTGDESVLEETVPYLRSGPLGEEEHERYEETARSERSGSIYEHCVMAIERSLRFGEHGLPLIGIGDWNDGLNRVGDEGRGESVWLAWFQCDILQRFAELCERTGDGERAKRYRDIRGQIAEAVDASAWDGQWFRRAFTDGGEWLGSVRNEECRIDAIAQSWSVLSGAAPRDKAVQAMQSFDRELVDRSLNVVRLLTPPFHRTEPSPGYIQGYPPGIRENGAQYTHGVLWSIIAWCKLGCGDKAFELFHMLNPITHTQTQGEIRKYYGEPYSMAADVYTASPHEGRAGWTWYTGAAGWMYQAGVEWIVGLRRRRNRLHIDPCIPAEWPEFAASYRYGTARYEIAVKNPERKCSVSEHTTMRVDGQEVRLEGNFGEDGPYVELKDDGRTHRIVLTL